MKAISIFLVLGLVLASPALADRKLLQGPTIAPTFGPTSPPPASPTTQPPATPISAAVVVPQQCRCLHNAGSTNGPSYCYQPVQTPAGNSTSSDCVPPVGYGCTATDEYAAQVRQIFPVAGPFFKCNDAPVSPPQGSPATPPLPNNPSPPPTPDATPTPLGAVTPATPSTSATPSSPVPSGLSGSDSNVLNFLLKVEYVEAEFYSYALGGSGLDGTLSGSGPASVGGAKASLSGDLQATITEFESLDKQRITYLRGVLGSAAVSRPQINIGSAFSDAANMALGSTLSPAFSPYGDDLSFLGGAFLFGDLQVRAYNTASRLLNSTDTRDNIAAMMAAKAYQAGVIRELLFKQRATATPYGIDSGSLVQSFAKLNNKLAGLPATNGIVNGSQAFIVPTIATGSAGISSWSQIQVLKVLCLGTPPGGFLPGNITGPVGPTTSNTVSG